VTAWASGWNARADALVCASITVVAAVVGLFLGRSVRGRWSVMDSAVPLLLLTATQLETFVNASNPAHGPLPLLLALLLAWSAAFIVNPRVRAAAVAVIAVVASHTGFAIFLSVVACVVLAMQLITEARAHRSVRAQWAALAAVIASLALFLVDYHFAPAVSCFVFPYPEPSRYLTFMAKAYLRVFELNGTRYLLFGLVMVGGTVAVILWSGWTILRTRGEDRTAWATFTLASFSLAFDANAAIGRVCLGDNAAWMGRYVSYFLPALLAIYWVLTTRPRPRWLQALFATVACCLLAIGYVVGADRSLRDAQFFSSRKERFLACYLGGNGLERCSTYWPVYLDLGAGRIQEKLDFMEERRLGPFLDR
jgi:hypothetical protein